MANPRKAKGTKFETEVKDLVRDSALRARIQPERYATESVGIPTLKDILDELRKQYKEPKADREAKILREARRLYKTTPQQEDEIIQEIGAMFGPAP